MPRRNVAAMSKRLRCGVQVQHTNTYSGETSTGPCGRTRAAHNETVSIKRKGEMAGVRVVRPAKVTDHEFADPVHVPVKCMACGEIIEIGTQYASWNPRMGAKHVRHLSCGSPPRSYFTSSEILATAWDIADQVVSMDGVEEIQGAEEMRDDYAEQVREIVEMIEEKVAAIQEYFESSPTIDELEERGYEYESWADEIESVDFSEFEVEDDFCTVCEMTEDEGPHWVQDPDFQHEYDQTDEMVFDLEGAQEALAEVVGNSPE